MKKESNQVQNIRTSSDTSKAVLALTAAALFDAAPEIPPKVDWAAAYRELSNHGLVSLTYPVAVNLDISDEVMKRWAASRDAYLRNSINNIHCHFALHKLLSNANYPYVILKGAASGYYYPDYLTRSYGDVDFLVDESNYEEVANYLISKGFEFKDENVHHKGFHKGSMEYELHKRPNGIPEGAVAAEIREFLSGAINQAVEFKKGNDVCMIPCDKHHALIMIVHCATHIKSTGIGLRQLCDWAAFAGKMSDEFFENEMQAILKKTGLWQFTKLLTSLCTKYLGLRSFRFSKDEDDEYLESFMDDILSSGNFGTKKSDEAHALRRQASFNAINKKKGKLHFMIKTFNESASYAFPIVKEKRFLMPVAWVYVGARHLVRMVRGERSMEFTKNLLTEDPNTRDFFEKWQLFESQED